MTQATQTIQKQIADLFEQARSGVRLKKAGSPPQCAVETVSPVRQLELQVKEILGRRASVDFGTMRSEDAKVLVSELRKLAKKYPKAKGWVRSFRVALRRRDSWPPRNPIGTLSREI